MENIETQNTVLVLRFFPSPWRRFNMDDRVGDLREGVPESVFHDVRQAMSFI